MSKVRILIVSDKENKYIWDKFDFKKFKDIDCIISCGDLKKGYLEYLATMINKPLFYVPGNHDVNYENNPPEGCININNKIIKFKGVRILGIGGCHKYSGGPYQYTQKEMERKIIKMKYKIWKNRGFDILVTHAPAYELGDGKDFCHQGFRSFKRLIDNYSPKYFFHGHQHLNYSYSSKRKIIYKDTIIINAYDHYIVEI